MSDLKIVVEALMLIRAFGDDKSSSIAANALTLVQAHNCGEALSDGGLAREIQRRNWVGAEALDERDKRKAAEARVKVLETALRAALIGWKNEVDMGDGFPETEAPIYAECKKALEGEA